MEGCERILVYLKHYKAALAVVTVCIVLSAIASVASSLFIQILIDQYITPLLGQSSPVYTGLLRALCVMGVIYIVGTAATWIYNIMSHYTNDTDTLRQMIAQSLAQLVSSVCTIAAVFGCMLYQSVYLTLIVVLAVSLILRIVKLIAGRSSFYFIRQQEALGELDG